MPNIPDGKIAIHLPACRHRGTSEAKNDEMSTAFTAFCVPVFGEDRGGATLLIFLISKPPKQGMDDKFEFILKISAVGDTSHKRAYLIEQSQYALTSR
jgi:hypothetical protein